MPDSTTPGINLNAISTCQTEEHAVEINNIFKMPLHGYDSQTIFTLQPFEPRKAALSIIPLSSGLAFCQFSPVPGVNVLKINYIPKGNWPNGALPIIIAPKNQHIPTDCKNTALVLSTGLLAKGSCNFGEGFFEIETEMMQLSSQRDDWPTQASFVERVIAHFDQCKPIDYLNMHNFNIYQKGVWFRKVTPLMTMI